ncbi:MAG TPA: CPBP family intramembrane glutamic endopeptidase [Steroidobacteraceae bacterium]
MLELTLLTYLALFCAIVGLWIGRVVWVCTYAVAVALGYASGVLSGPAIIWIALFAGLCLALTRAQRSLPAAGARAVIALAVLGIVVVALGLGMHVLPGFHNFLVVRGVVLTPGASPYTLYLNFDKATIGILIIGLLLPPLLRGARDWLNALRRALPVIVANLALVAVLSVSFGYIAFEPKWNPLFWIWAASNLFITCLSEEAFFRGFLQRGLERLLASRSGRQWIALAVASLLFGLAHFGGGLLYVVLATVAGAGYGLAYQRSGRLEMAMLAHFSLNAFHFLFFTYPALAR